MEERGRDEHKELLKKFEEMLASNSNLFFDLDEYEDVTEHYIETGEFEKAAQIILIAREQYPYAPELLEKQAHLALFTNKQDATIVEIHAFFDDHGFSEKLLTVLSMLYLDQNKLSHCIQCIDKLEELYGETSEYQYLYGSSYLTVGKYDMAIKHFKKSIELDLENEAALYDLAYCLELEGELEDSISFYKKFIDIDPYSYYAWFNLGVIYNKLEMHEKAVDAFEYALAIHDKFSSAMYNLGNTYVIIQNWDKAIEHFKNCLECELPSADIYSKIGECYELKGEFQNAIKNYRKAIDLDPNKESALLGMATIMLSSDKYKEAIHYTQKCLKENNYRYDYWLLLAKAEAKIGNEVAAMEAFEKTIEINNKDAEAFVEYANFFIDIGEFERARDLIITAIEVLPNNAMLHYLATVASIKEGKFKESVSYLENALFLAPEKKEVLYKYFDSIDEQKAILALLDTLSS